MSSQIGNLGCGRRVAIVVTCGFAVAGASSISLAGDEPVCGDQTIGSCFVPHQVPGCSDAACCSLVCVVDPFCCTTEWDFVCRQTANDEPGCGVVAPANDLASSPMFIEPGLVPFTTIGATDSSELAIPADCGGLFGDEIRRDVWFEYRAAVNGIATISSCPTTQPGVGSEIDLIVLAREPSSLTVLACNDEGLGCGGYVILNLAVTAGTRYLIQVGGHDMEIGSGVLLLAEVGTPAPAPSNDACASALAVAIGTTVSFDLLGATRGDATCTDTLDDVWFTVGPAKASGKLTLQACGSDAPTRLEVASIAAATGACELERLCGPITNCATPTDLVLEMTAGASALVRVASESRSVGTLTTSYEAVAPCPADRDGDGVVSAPDLSLILLNWGGTGGDINGDGTTSAADLSLVLEAWGICR